VRRSEPLTVRTALRLCR